MIDQILNGICLIDFLKSDVNARSPSRTSHILIEATPIKLSLNTPNEPATKIPAYERSGLIGVSEAKNWFKGDLNCGSLIGLCISKIHQSHVNGWYLNITISVYQLIANPLTRHSWMVLLSTVNTIILCVLFRLVKKLLLELGCHILNDLADFFCISEMDGCSCDIHALDKPRMDDPSVAYWIIPQKFAKNAIK